VILSVVRFVVRYLAPVYSVRKRLWNSIIAPYLAWRSFTVVATDQYGGKFRLVTSDTIQRAIYLFGIWEPHVAGLIRGILKPGDTFVDVGANIGYFSVMASRLVGPSGKVVSIEASSAMFERLKDSLQRNSCSNTRPVRGAVSDSKGTIKLYLPDAEEGNCGLGSMVRETSTFEESPADTIGHWLLPEEIKTVRLMKIDVEGAESMVMSGLREILPLLPQNAEILAEISPDWGGSDQVFSLMEQAGFSAWALPGDTLEGYFQPEVKLSLAKVVNLQRRTDVLFSRRDLSSVSHR
jgi:FkbM family methyltransferase